MHTGTFLFPKQTLVMTSPAGTVAKYCDEHVCLCVCLSVRQDISGATCAIFTIFSVHVAYARDSIHLRQGDEIPRGRGSLGVFFPIDNAS